MAVTITGLSFLIHNFTAGVKITALTAFGVLVYAILSFYFQKEFVFEVIKIMPKPYGIFKRLSGQQ
jgi:hypothetical protein